MSIHVWPVATCRLRTVPICSMRLLQYSVCCGLHTWRLAYGITFHVCGSNTVTFFIVRVWFFSIILRPTVSICRMGISPYFIYPTLCICWHIFNRVPQVCGSNTVSCVVVKWFLLHTRFPMCMLFIGHWWPIPSNVFCVVCPSLYCMISFSSLSKNWCFMSDASLFINQRTSLEPLSYWSLSYFLATASYPPWLSRVPLANGRQMFGLFLGISGPSVCPFKNL